MSAEVEIGHAVAPSEQRFSLREVARILEVPETRLRALARAGFLTPQRGPIGPLSFGFRDLLLLRTTKGLLQSGVPMRRIRRIWTSLRQQLSADLPLTSITIHTDGEEVVASDGEARWRPDSGQFLLDFEAGEIAERALDMPGFGRLSIVEGTASPRPAAGGSDLLREGRIRSVVRGEVTPGDAAGAPELGAGRYTADSFTAEPFSAEQWYEEGCELEASSPEQAREAYERALALDPGIADAHINLGRQLHIAGERGRAEPHYREAAKLDPDDPTPHFNLGVLLDEAGRREEAVLAYRQAILRDPDFADAHCNLGLLLELLGRRPEAVRHLMAAHRLSGAQD